MVYIDEAGTSEPEPVALVVGIIVNMDAQWRDIAEYLAFVRRRYGLGEDHIFHAKELFSGGKKFPRDKWSHDQRLLIMRRILSIPRKFRLPIVMGYFRQNEKSPVVVRHAAAFAMCLKRANDFIKDDYPDEIGMVVAENVEHMRTVLSRTPNLIKAAGPTNFPELTRHPYDAIADQIHFVDKKSAPLLQIADHVAFALRSFMSEHKYGPRLAGLVTSKAAIWEGIESQGRATAGMAAISFNTPTYFVENDGTLGALCS